MGGFADAFLSFQLGFLAGKTSVHSFQRVLFQTAATMTRQLEGMGGEYVFPHFLYLNLLEGVKWLLMGVNLPSLRVELAPLGRCWYLEDHPHLVGT